MKSIIFTFITIFIGISIAVPIKDHDDLVLRVNELRRLNPYQDDLRFYIRNLDSIGGGNLLRSLNSVIDRSSSSSSSSLSKDGFYGKNAIEMNNGNYGDGENEEHVYGKFVQNNHGMGNNVPHREKRAIDLDRNPTLYSYYSGLLNNINDKRNPAFTTNNERKLEKIILLQDSFEPYDYASSSRLVEEPLGKRNFDEIDRALIGGLKKRLSTYKLPRLYNSYDNNSPIDVSSKRNFDEIDRAGFTTLKRNGFDEIDRAGFVSLKRNLLNLANSADRYPSLSSSASRSAILNGYSMEKHD